jgi:sialic acid synthase SpsE
MISIIVEPDVSHGGDLGYVLTSIRKSALEGAQFYKLQCYSAKDLGPEWHHKTNFYSRCCVDDRVIRESELECRKYGMELVCTANTPKQVDRVYKLGVRNVKIASGQICKDILDRVITYEWDRVFISTGMQGDSGLSMIHFDYKDELKKQKEVVIMHCVSLYPPMDTEQNLLRIESIQEKFFPHDGNFVAGYSDHSEKSDIMACEIASALGAEYIELHVHDTGSISPVSKVGHSYCDVRCLRSRLDRIELMLGDGGIMSQEREDEVYEKYKGRWVW